MPTIAGNGGIVIVSVPLALCVLAGPPYLAVVVFRHNRRLPARGKAVLAISAAATAIFRRLLVRLGVSS